MALYEIVFPQARLGIAGDCGGREANDAFYAIANPNGSLEFHVFIEADEFNQAVPMAAQVYYKFYQDSKVVKD